jgi:hypothetical protein
MMMTDRSERSRKVIRIGNIAKQSGTRPCHNTTSCQYTPTESQDRDQHALQPERKPPIKNEKKSEQFGATPKREKKKGRKCFCFRKKSVGGTENEGALARRANSEKERKRKMECGTSCEWPLRETEMETSRSQKASFTNILEKQQNTRATARKETADAQKPLANRETATQRTEQPTKQVYALASRRRHLQRTTNRHAKKERIFSH